MASYEELIDALNRLLIAPGQPPDVYELALAYRNALDLQFTTLKNAAHSGRAKDKLFYYSLMNARKVLSSTLSTAPHSCVVAWIAPSPWAAMPRRRSEIAGLGIEVLQRPHAYLVSGRRPAAMISINL
jgi:hypothetical protein